MKVLVVSWITTLHTLGPSWQNLKEFPLNACSNLHGCLSLQANSLLSSLAKSHLPSHGIVWRRHLKRSDSLNAFSEQFCLATCCSISVSAYVNFPKPCGSSVAAESHKARFVNHELGDDCHKIRSVTRFVSIPNLDSDAKQDGCLIRQKKSVSTDFLPCKHLLVPLS